MKPLLFVLMGLFSTQILAQDLALQGFQKRFTLVKNAEGKVVAVKLNRAVRKFTIRPFIEQIKDDLTREQAAFNGLTSSQKEAEVDSMLEDMGVDIYALHGNENGRSEAERVKESILNVKNINIEEAFLELDQVDFWKEFESKLNEAFMFIDPSILANLEDSRFFYKRQVTYRVVIWALEQAKKRFSSMPILNIASFVIVRVHDMMMEQRHFHHNMLLHYFESIPETKLGMTKEEVDRTVSSIYEYRIEAENVFESNRASGNWMDYGMNNFYSQVRAGNNKIRNWSESSNRMDFENAKKMNFAFGQVTHEGAQKIYHLHHNAHQFSSKPALAYDFSQPQKVKRNRSLLNIAGVALGFLNIPGWIKSNVDNFMKSMYVSQVRTEGALVGYFETSGDAEMIRRIYAQRANFYIVE